MFSPPPPTHQGAYKPGWQKPEASQPRASRPRNTSTLAAALFTGPARARSTNDGDDEEDGGCVDHDDDDDDDDGCSAGSAALQLIPSSMHASVSCICSRCLVMYDHDSAEKAWLPLAVCGIVRSVDSL